MTTMWDETDRAVGEVRENEIRTKYWPAGFHVLRFDKTANSVWAAVDYILSTGNV